MALLEVGKGCGRGCRFCLEGQVYRPVRHRSVDALRETVEQLAAGGEQRIGLVGACVSDYPWIGDLLKIVEDNGMELSISSLRADSLTEELVASLARGGHRTLTIAPEAGTERLRRVIRKAITDEQILGACDLVRAHGIPNLKTLLHDRPADRDRRGRGGDPRSGARACSSGCACSTPTGQPVRTAHAVDLVVRAQAVDAVPVGALRRGRRAAGASSRSSSAACGASPTCACCTRTRARPRCRRCWRAATAAWPTSSSARRGWAATGGARCASGTATPTSTRRAPRAIDERMPWDHFDVGVKKAGPRPRVGAGRRRRRRRRRERA